MASVTVARLSCSRCGETKPPEEFYWSRTKGTLSHAWCKECQKAAQRAAHEADPQTAKENARRYRSENGELVKESSRIRRTRDAAKIKDRNARYYLANRDAFLEYSSTWKKANPEKAREQAKRAGAKKRSTPKGRLDAAMSSNIRNGLAYGAKRGRRTFQILGYTLDDLMAHLERQFTDGMTWANYGKGGWHVDHKIPLAVHNYDHTEHTDFKRAWALTNLQPLWEADNISKGAKLEVPFQPSLALQFFRDHSWPQT